MPYEFEKNNRPQPNIRTCPAVGCQDATVSVPVNIEPFAVVGKIKTTCVGEPIIKKGSDSCEGRPNCSCKFVISQKVKVEVPVEFGTKTFVGETFIDCGEASSEKHCDCD